MLDATKVVAAFTEAQVAGLTGLSIGQLRYWDRTDVYRAAWRDGAHGPVRRLYSFRDLVALRTISLLRVSHNVPLQELRRVASKLAHLEDRHWTSMSLYVLKRRVVFHEPGTDLPREVVSGQYAIPTALQRVVEETRDQTEDLRRRPPAAIGQVVRRRGVLNNAAVIAGTRIAVGAVRRLAEDGFTEAQIMAEYPDLTPADIRAALAQPRAA